MSHHLILPKGYRPLLGVKETEHAIKGLKDFFELNLATELNLSRVTAPLFVKGGTGINDDLNGVERPVAFPVKDMAGRAGRDRPVPGQVEADDARANSASSRATGSTRT